MARAALAARIFTLLLAMFPPSWSWAKRRMDRLTLIKFLGTERGGQDQRLLLGTGTLDSQIRLKTSCAQGDLTHRARTRVCASFSATTTHKVHKKKIETAEIVPPPSPYAA
ncbi:hypothetical protein DFJ73DRAFT_824130 [Zopfochytrium polystomum]|nr:hypothetical protein DFJ73DRAFT_824130 [Zopfochytrium polystomum]